MVKSLKAFAAVLLVFWGLMAMSCTTPKRLAIMTDRMPLNPSRYRANSAPNMELYGTFHAMGVIVSLPPKTDLKQNMIARVAYRATGDDTFQEGFPLSRVSNDRFVGSIFNLVPGVSYEIIVAFDGPKVPSWDLTYIKTTGSTRAEIVIPDSLQTLIVSPDGDGEACSEESPCNLCTALNQAMPGTEIKLRGGVYYEGDFTLPASGTAAHPIVIRGYANEAAILDGSYPFTLKWTNMGEGLYSTTLNIKEPHVVIHNGQRLFPYPNINSLKNLHFRLSGFFTEDSTLYVRLTGRQVFDPGQVVVSRFGSAFHIEQEYIYFMGLTFRYYGQGDYPKAIYLYNASNNLVQGCIFASNDIGVGIKRLSHRNVIQDCVFYDTISRWSWNAIKSHGRLEDGGIFFFDPVDGRGNIIRRNTFHDDYDGFNACPTSSESLTNETDVYENIVYNMGDDGMETDGRCSNVRIWENTFHDVLIGISLAPVEIGPVYCLRNLIYRTGAGNNNYNGAPFKFNSSHKRSGPIFLFHNTSSAVYGGNYGFSIKKPGTWELIYSRNNIWVGTDYAIYNNNDFESVDMDYDDLWNGGDWDLVFWSYRYLNLTSFTNDTDQEAHGLSFDPLFKDPSVGDFALSYDSPLVDAGALIPGINHWYRGLKPDIGAFER